MRHIVSFPDDDTQMDPNDHKKNIDVKIEEYDDNQPQNLDQENLDEKENQN